MTSIWTVASCMTKIAAEKIGQAEFAMRSERIGNTIAKLEQQAVVNLPLTKEEQVEYNIDDETLQR